MGLINFASRVNFTLIENPETNAFFVGYDMDGILKQKDHYGVIKPIGLTSSSSSPFYLTGGSDAQGNKTASIYRVGSIETYNSIKSNYTVSTYSNFGNMTFSNAIGSNLEITGSHSFIYKDGFEGSGKYLSSGANGQGKWKKIQASEIEDLYTLVSTNYEGLEELANNNQLIVGAKYILLDYKTIYQINDTNTSNVSQLHTMIGHTGNYTMFTNVPTTMGSSTNFAGIIVTVVSKPAGSSLVVGATYSVAEFYSSNYIRLSPTIVGAANYGTVLRFEKQRYPNVEPNATYLDINGKPIMKPNGVLNTEVHDGTAYGPLSALDNPEPITETLVLTAIGTNAFSRDAESLTFPGDKLTYDFTQNKVYDEEGNIIATRPGLIIKRTNLNGSITANVDWRVRRFRRYALDTATFNSYRLLTANIYRINGTASGNNVCTTTNDTIGLSHSYLARSPFTANMYQDFSKGLSNTDNIFIIGTSSAPSSSSGNRISYGWSSEFSMDANITTFTQSFADFHVIPIKDGEAQNVSLFNVGSITNSVFLPYTQTYGNASSLYVNSPNGTITNCTFASLPIINNTGELTEVRSLDYLMLDNYGEIVNSNLFPFLFLSNRGKIYNSTIGGGKGSNTRSVDMDISDDSLIINSIIGGHRVDKVYFTRFLVNKSLFMMNQSSANTFSAKMYLTQVRNASSMFGCNFDINTFHEFNTNGKYGYSYAITSDIYDKNLNNFTNDKRLVYSILGSDNIMTSVTVSTSL